MSEAVAELRKEGHGEVVVEVDGVLYCGEDLYQCEGCELRALYRFELGDDGLCCVCTDEAEHVRQLRSDYYAGLLP